MGNAREDHDQQHEQRRRRSCRAPPYSLRLMERPPVPVSTRGDVPPLNCRALLETSPLQSNRPFDPFFQQSNRARMPASGIERKLECPMLACQEDCADARLRPGRPTARDGARTIRVPRLQFRTRSRPAPGRPQLPDMSLAPGPSRPGARPAGPRPESPHPAASSGADGSGWPG